MLYMSAGDGEALWDEIMYLSHHSAVSYPKWNIGEEALCIDTGAFTGL